MWSLRRDRGMAPTFRDRRSWARGSAADPSPWRGVRRFALDLHWRGRGRWTMADIHAIRARQAVAPIDASPDLRLNREAQRVAFLYEPVWSKNSSPTNQSVSASVAVLRLPSTICGRSMSRRRGPVGRGGYGLCILAYATGR